MRILLVEDDPAIAAELSLRWTRQGWDTTPAATLRAAETALASLAWARAMLARSRTDGLGSDNSLRSVARGSAVPLEQSAVMAAARRTGCSSLSALITAGSALPLS